MLEGADIDNPHLPHRPDLPGVASEVECGVDRCDRVVTRVDGRRAAGQAKISTENGSFAAKCLETNSGV